MYAKERAMIIFAPKEFETLQQGDSCWQLVLYAKYALANGWEERDQR
jgi:hypothetical protein